MTEGYIIVGNMREIYYRSALYLIDSIREYDPNRPICLTTEQRFVTGKEDIDDLIICNDHERAKLYGIANSPYDKTYYIDADCEVIHEDLPTIFDKFDGNDILFTSLAEERIDHFAELYFPGGKFTWCG